MRYVASPVAPSEKEQPSGDMADAECYCCHHVGCCALRANTGAGVACLWVWKLGDVSRQVPLFRLFTWTFGWVA